MDPSRIGQIVGRTARWRLSRRTALASGGASAVAAMLAGGGTPVAGIQRAPKVEYTPPPHRIPLDKNVQLPGIKPRRHDFIPEKRKQRPLAQGSFSVAGIGVGYELKTDAWLTAGMAFRATPAELTNIELIARGAEAERLRGRPDLIPGLPIGDPFFQPPKPRGTLEGSARLRFDAEVALDASALAVDFSERQRLVGKDEFDGMEKKYKV